MSPITFIILNMLADLQEAGLSNLTSTQLEEWSTTRKRRHIEGIIDSIAESCPQTVAALVRRALNALEHERPTIFKQPRSIAAIEDLLVDKLGIAAYIVYGRLHAHVEESVWYRMGKMD